MAAGSGGESILVATSSLRQGESDGPHCGHEVVTSVSAHIASRRPNSRPDSHDQPCARSRSFPSRMARRLSTRSFSPKLNQLSVKTT